MYSYGPPYMAVQKQDDQLELTYSNYVRTQDVTRKTCQRRWMIGRSGERGSGISVLAAQHDDDDDDDFKQLSLTKERSLNANTALFQVIQFSMSTQFSFSLPIHRNLSGATTLNPSGTGSDSNERVLNIPQISTITGTSPSDFLCHIQDTHRGGSYPSAEKQSVCSTAPADWANSRTCNVV